jgi:hypothetical protein
MDDEGALAALHTFTQCADFDIDFLYLAALESQSKSALRCAQEAYTLLYREVTTAGTAGAAKAASCPGYFAQLLVRNASALTPPCTRAHHPSHRRSAISSR